MGAFQGTETVTRSSLVAAWTLFACMPAPVGAVDCSFRDQRSGTVLEREVALSGRASQTFSASIPGGNYLIVASERGVDVQVASLLPAQSPAIADSPFARMGDQLLALSVPATTTLTLELAGKDDPKASGTARVKVQAVSTACLTALRPVIDAHASYARAERVRRGIDPTAARDAQTEYRSATQALRTAVDDPVIAADAHMHAALKLELAIALYEGSKEWSAAAEAAESARNAYEALNDEYAIATADAIRATALMEMALTANAGERLAKARELLASVIATHAARGEIYEQALAQNNLGLSFFYEGRADEALSAFREALELHESLHEPMRRAQVLQNMAVVHLDSGRFTRAVPEYEDVLSSLSRDAYPHLYGSVLNNSALANAVVGNLDVALERYATALAIWTELQNPREQARSRNGLGYVYYLAGDYERAQDFYEQALVQRTAALDGSGRASTLRTLGNLYRMSGRPQIALAMHREALGLAANAIARDGALIQIARDFAALPDRSRALAVLDWVTNDSKNPDALTIAYAELERGRVRLSAGDLEGVGSGIEDALNAFRTNDLTGEQIECLIELARLARMSGNETLALSRLDRALEISDGLRSQALSPELKATLVQPARAAANLKIEILESLHAKASRAGEKATMDRLSQEALATTERARARVLNELRTLDSGSPESLDASMRRESLYRQLAEARYEFQRLSSRYGSSDPRSLFVRQNVAELQTDLDRLNRMAPTPSPQVHAANVAAMAPGACAIVYWVNDDHAYIWSVMRETVQWETIGNVRSLEAGVRGLLDNLRSRGSAIARRQLAQELRSTLLKPVSAQCLMSQRLYVVADAILHYVPFALLPDPADSQGRPMIALRDIAFSPALGMLRNVEDKMTRPARVLVVSDPVYSVDDERLSAGTHDRVSFTAISSRRGEAGSRLARLRFSAAEAQAIQASFEPSAVTLLSGLDASRSRFLSLNLDTYEYVHVVAHGQFDVAAPRLSSLVLSTVDRTRMPVEGRIWGGDLAARRLRARLAVLSGCETALGQYVHGEGLMGFQYVMLGRGAESVIATFWPVPDMQSAELMRDLYRHMRAGEEHPVRALAMATRDAIDRGVDPATWGAFNILTTTMQERTARVAWQRSPVR